MSELHPDDYPFGGMPTPEQEDARAVTGDWLTEEEAEEYRAQADGGAGQ